jgi:hypothetical protein
MSGLNQQARVFNHAERISYSVGTAEGLLTRALLNIADCDIESAISSIKRAQAALAAPYDRISA